MREMKNTGVVWCEKIPVKWNLIKYKHFSNSRMGETILASDTDDEGVPIYSATQDNSVFGFIKTPNLILHKNDIVIPARGNSIGCATLIKDEIATCTQTTICSTDITGINVNFLLHCCYGLKDYWFKYDGAAIPQITVSQVKNNFVPVAPIQEQDKISDFLDDKCSKVDTLIGNQEIQIEKLKQYKQSLITEVVTKGLNPDVEMKDSTINYIDVFPSHWENRKMLSILSMRVIDGPHESPELLDEGIPYISATAIENGKIDFQKMRGYISEEYCNECDKRYKPQINDILVIKLGASTGQVAIVETDMRFNIWVPLAVVRCNEFAVPKFVYYAFQSDYFIKQMEQSWTYGTQQTLGVKTIERLRILLPECKEQQEIVSYLDEQCVKIDKLIEIKQSKIAKLNEYKKSLIYEYVTGKKEVV